MSGIGTYALIFGPYIVFFLISLAVLILVTRWVGAWMLRINDVIRLQKEILEELKKINLQS